MSCFQITELVEKYGKPSHENGDGLVCEICDCECIKKPHWKSQKCNWNDEYYYVCSSCLLAYTKDNNYSIKMKVILTFGKSCYTNGNGIICETCEKIDLQEPLWIAPWHSHCHSYCRYTNRPYNVCYSCLLTDFDKPFGGSKRLKAIKLFGKATHKNGNGLMCVYCKMSDIQEDHWETGSFDKNYKPEYACYQCVLNFFK